MAGSRDIPNRDTESVRSPRPRRLGIAGGQGGFEGTVKGGLFDLAGVPALSGGGHVEDEVIGLGFVGAVLGRGFGEGSVLGVGVDNGGDEGDEGVGFLGAQGERERDFPDVGLAVGAFVFVEAEDDFAELIRGEDREFHVDLKQLFLYFGHDLT